MQKTQTQVDTRLVNLYRLPKDKLILDYVLQKLSHQASPERFELITSLFELYRISAGFDPLALSKGRFKRIKASEFRGLLKDIDMQLADVLESEEYKQLVARQTDIQLLFSTYAKLSDELNVHPPSTMIHDVAEFEQKLEEIEATELQMQLYRQHHHFIQVSRNAQKLEEFLQKYDEVEARNRHHSLRVRTGVLVCILEENHQAGKAQHKRMNEVWDSINKVLSMERNRFVRYEVLLDLIRLGRLMPNPANRLATFLTHAAPNAADILLYNSTSKAMFYATLAQYHPSASAGEKSGWLQQADLIAREQGAEDTRAYYRMVRSLIAADAGDIIQALRHLDEAEHQIHKGVAKSFSARNTWIEICRLRTFLFALQHLRGVTQYDDDQYRQQQRLAEDLSQHRYDSAVIGLELNGLHQLVNRQWQEAAELFARALRYRTDEPRDAISIIDEYLSILCSTEKKKEARMLGLINELEALNEPFYSSAAKELLLSVKQAYASAHAASAS